MRVVERFDVDEDGEASFRPVGEPLPLDQLAFERRKEGLSHRIIKAVPYRSHRRADASIPLDFHGDGQRLREIEHQEEIEAAENSTRLRSKALAFSGLGEFSEVLGKDREEIEVAIKEFIETWNGEILWRNATQRPMPDESDRKVVVAGERSMGDEPGGAYQVLKKAFAMGIAQHFGCQ